ncbi:hypothetical protein MP228_002600 [Amoeboaphelidium protococcarum]|nr:hypothetical protein MP228_002600 [Amoeboaphelidium protococcarum]
MLNISYNLCGAHTVCWYVGPSLVSSFLYNHSLVLSRRLKQSRYAALLYLALSTAYSTGMVSFTHHGIGLSCNSLSSIQCKLLLCFFATYMLRGVCWKVKVSLCYGAASGSSLFRQLLLQLCPSLLSSRTQLRVPLRLGAKSLQLTGADGSTHSATGFSIYDGVCWFVYHWLLAVGHGCQIGLVDISTSMISWTPLITCGITLVLLVYVPTEVRPVTVGPLKGALCLIIYSLSHGIVFGCTAHLDSAPTFGGTAHLGRFVSVSVSCLCSKYVPTEVRPVTVGPLKGALCLIIYSYPTALLLAVLHTWTLPRLLAVLHTWVVCLSVLSVSDVI